MTTEIMGRIAASERPVVMVGTGVSLAGAQKAFLALVDKLGIPVVTAWNAHDIVPNAHPLFCGRPGTLGTRGGNFVVQGSDLLLVLGCRLNIRQISYTKGVFAKNAYKIAVDIDERELRKLTVDIDMPVHANVTDVIDALLAAPYGGPTRAQQEWLVWAREVDASYPAVLPEYNLRPEPLNPYAFIRDFSAVLDRDDDVVCGNGSACVITFQAMEVKDGQRWFANSGCAAMGYGFPASIGCAVANRGKRTICLDGDGSFQMNLQELSTVVANDLNLKVFVISNDGYHSIRQTQSNNFEPPLVGVGAGSGLWFPPLEALAAAWGISFTRIVSLDSVGDDVRRVLSEKGPALVEVVVDSSQPFSPKLSSRVHEDGTITSPDIDDMFPFLPRDEYEARHCFE